MLKPFGRHCCEMFGRMKWVCVVPGQVDAFMWDGVRLVRLPIHLSASKRKQRSSRKMKTFQRSGRVYSHFSFTVPDVFCRESRFAHNSEKTEGNPMEWSFSPRHTNCWMNAGTNGSIAQCAGWVSGNRFFRREGRATPNRTPVERRKSSRNHRASGVSRLGPVRFAITCTTDRV